MKSIFGTKLGMTQIIGENGVMIPITLLQAAPCTVTQVKTVENDGYTAVQVGFGDGKNLSNAVAGHVKESGVTPKTLREIRIDDKELGEIKVGDKISADIFSVGDSVDVSGISKGKGWAGTIKRYNFKRHRKTHGGKGNTRKVGSIGSMYPQKVMKGHPMAGQMGAENTTVKNLTVAYLDTERNLIGVKGAVPGPKKGIVEINGKETK
ncbi:50S ribosomal protein L3 [Candidatus Saccharibacteria bacterium]|nr:50S ribosomal protein L3 [Candidatus Saccharibacteria bacterium]MCL1962688.1 50S ribosomal protein L3 [Candidatus Saccharibacteria bacterium]